MTDHFKGDEGMRIAIPMAEGKLSMHFGHCEQFALLDVDPQAGTILGRKDVEPPPHEPGLTPPWLAERDVNLVISGGMGRRAQQLFAARNVVWSAHPLERGALGGRVPGRDAASRWNALRIIDHVVHLELLMKAPVLRGGSMTKLALGSPKALPVRCLSEVSWHDSKSNLYPGNGGSEEF